MQRAFVPVMILLFGLMQDGVAPEVSVKLPAGNVLKFHTWTQIIQVFLIILDT